MSVIDYSKWDNIELSDEESGTWKRFLHSLLWKSCCCGSLPFSRFCSGHLRPTNDDVRPQQAPSAYFRIANGGRNNSWRCWLKSLSPIPERQKRTGAWKNICDPNRSSQLLWAACQSMYLFFASLERMETHWKRSRSTFELGTTVGKTTTLLEDRLIAGRITWCCLFGRRKKLIFPFTSCSISFIVFGLVWFLCQIFPVLLEETKTVRKISKQTRAHAYP